MNNIMLDIETYGTCPSPVILSIGAVQFDITTGEIGEQFNMVVDLDSYKDTDEFQQDDSTVQWWSEQSEEARARLFGDDVIKYPLKTVLEEFTKFYERCVDVVDDKFCHVWGNGSEFDISHTASAYHHMELKTPWPYYAACDCRTLTMLTKGFVDRKDFTFEGVEHDAIDDCKYQIRWTVEMYRQIKTGLNTQQKKGFIETCKTILMRFATVFF
jgi:hypothetical protein